MEAWPAPDLELLARSAEDLAGRLVESDLRAQAYALAAVIRQLGREQIGSEQRRLLDAQLAEAIAGGDENAVVEALRGLAAHDRSAVLEVNWSKVTGG